MQLASAAAFDQNRSFVLPLDVSGTTPYECDAARLLGIYRSSSKLPSPQAGKKRLRPSSSQPITSNRRVSGPNIVRLEHSTSPVEGRRHSSMIPLPSNKTNVSETTVLDQSLDRAKTQLSGEARHDLSITDEVVVLHSSRYSSDAQVAVSLLFIPPVSKDNERKFINLPILRGSVDTAFDSSHWELQENRLVANDRENNCSPVNQPVFDHPEAKYDLVYGLATPITGPAVVLDQVTPLALSDNQSPSYTTFTKLDLEPGRDGRHTLGCYHVITFAQPFSTSTGILTIELYGPPSSEVVFVKLDDCLCHHAQELDGHEADDVSVRFLVRVPCNDLDAGEAVMVMMTCEGRTTEAVHAPMVRLPGVNPIVEQLRICRIRYPVYVKLSDDALLGWHQVQETEEGDSWWTFERDATDEEGCKAFILHLSELSLPESPIRSLTNLVTCMSVRVIERHNGIASCLAVCHFDTDASKGVKHVAHQHAEPQESLIRIQLPADARVRSVEIGHDGTERLHAGADGECIVMCDAMQLSGKDVAIVYDARLLTSSTGAIMAPLPIVKDARVEKYVLEGGDITFMTGVSDLCNVDESHESFFVDEAKPSRQVRANSLGLLALFCILVAQAAQMYGRHEALVTVYHDMDLNVADLSDRFESLLNMQENILSQIQRLSGVARMNALPQQSIVVPEESELESKEPAKKWADDVYYQLQQLRQSRERPLMTIDDREREAFRRFLGL
ncbi:hypothetical protein PYCC9005_001778 [Savitreella phatthalungensis]